MTAATIAGTDVAAALEMVTSALQPIVPAPRITTRKLSVNGRDLLVVEVQKSGSFCSAGGVVYTRIGSSIRPLSIQEILMLSTELGIIAWDEAPATALYRLHNPRRSSEIAGEVGLSRPTGVRRVKTLEGLGLVRREGAGAHTRYVATR